MFGWQILVLSVFQSHIPEFGEHSRRVAAMAQRLVNDVKFVEVVVGEGHGRKCRCWTGVGDCCRLKRVERIMKRYGLGRMVDSFLAWENVDASLDPNRNLDAVWSGDAA